MEWLLRYYGNYKGFRGQTDFFQFFEKLIGESLAGASSDFADGKTRLFFQEKLLASAEKRIPYRYLGECFCGKNKFLACRRDFYRRLAKGLGLLD